MSLLESNKMMHAVRSLPDGSSNVDIIVDIKIASPLIGEEPLQKMTLFSIDFKNCVFAFTSGLVNFNSKNCVEGFSAGILGLLGLFLLGHLLPFVLVRTHALKEWRGVDSSGSSQEQVAPA